MLRPVIDRLPGRPEICFIGDYGARVRISIETRKITARYLDPNTMPGKKHVARDARIDGYPVDLAGFREFRLFEAVPVSKPQNAICQVARLAVGEDVYEFRREVRIRSTRGYE